MNTTQKLNMQISGTDEIPSPLQNMNLIDDFMFDVATVDLEICKIILELSMGIRIKNIRWKEGQKVIHNLPEKRGIRMDFYVEDEAGQIYDVEMQKRNEGNIPKRMRFYQALLDAPLLDRGEKGFDGLNPTYIIVICGFDLYGFDKYRYTFENLCHEVPGLQMGDMCTKIVLNTRGKDDRNVEKSLIDFLHYIEKSEDGSIPDECDERILRLHEKVKGIRSNRQMGVTYMKMEERDRLIESRGERKGEMLKLIQMVCAKLGKGKQPEQIAGELEEELPVIIQICEAAKKCAPEYDSKEILERMKYT